MSLKIIGLSVFAFLMQPFNAQAYPDFISFGYSTCITCHSNGLGGGALNDYGRALWSSEIASRQFFSKNTTDEELGARSGFLGKTQLPWWVRPSIKYRSLWLRSNPGGSTAKDQFFQMQNDLGLTTAFSEEQKYLVTGTWGYEPRLSDFGKAYSNRYLLKEFYLRAEIKEQMWLYAGLHEKVFGIRYIDHTAYAKTYTGLSQAYAPNASNQAIASGLTLHKVKDEYEWALNLFAGHPRVEAEEKLTGVSVWSEFNVGENKRIGGSLMTEKNDFLNRQSLAVFFRSEVGKGNSLMAEQGFVQKATTDIETINSMYTWLQGQILLQRGLFLKGNVERSIPRTKENSTESWRNSLGFLWFPAPRFEFRLEGFSEKNITPTNSTNDRLSVRGQVRASF